MQGLWQDILIFVANFVLGIFQQWNDNIPQWLHYTADNSSEGISCSVRSSWVMVVVEYDFFYVKKARKMQGTLSEPSRYKIQAVR